MNKRQWKKKYKKEHGCNPPTCGQVNSWIETLAGSINALVEGFKKAFSEIKKNLNEMIELIRTMPEEEFEEKLKELTPQQRAIAIEVRNGRKVSDEDVG